MTNEEARWILKFHRPDRPRSADRRQLQKAIDVILDEGEWIEDDYAGIHCSECSYIPLKDVVIKIYADGTKERIGNYNLTHYCPNCGKKMKH